MSSFGDSLKRIRKERHFSQDELAALLGTTKQVISRYENGQRSPKISVALEYAEKLGVPIAVLAGVGSDGKPLPPAVEPAVDDGPGPLSPDESHMLDLFRALNPAGQRIATRQVEALVEESEFRRGELSASAN